MCNLYTIKSNQRDIGRAAKAERDLFGNLMDDYSVYPDYPAPIVRVGADGVRELVSARWGMPTPPKFLEGKKCDIGVTNIRNVSSPHWRRWLGVESRCVVPMTSFSEYQEVPGQKRKALRWFALDESMPLAWLAGIWTNWTCVRKVKEGEVTADIFAFLTTEANAVVAPIHAKAMPVILTTPEEIDVWLSAPAKEALTLQKPLPDDALMLLPLAAKSEEASLP